MIKNGVLHSRTLFFFKNMLYCYVEKIYPNGKSEPGHIRNGSVPARKGRGLMYHHYQIAGLQVRMKTCGRTLAQAEPYLTAMGTQADIVITGNPEILHQQQPHLSMDDCEYLTTGASFYRQLLKYDGMLLHASAVVMDGYAYLFSAPCGTGKSTHTRLWVQHFGPEQARILNDDKPALRREEGRWYAYGTPWSGKTSQNLNLRVPLGGVCILTRGEENSICPIEGREAIFALLEQTARPADAVSRGQLLTLVGQLLEEIPVWHMVCRPDREAAAMSQAAMSGEAGRRWSRSAGD